MGKNAQASWDDIRFILAVADHGSVSAAAKAMSVNHATVLRRIAAFEDKQGLRIFDKTPRGYRVSADRRQLIEAMREAGNALVQVDQLIDAERPQLEHVIRVTSTDSFCFSLLPPIFIGLADEIGAPIDVITGNTHLDLAKLHAHITVRPAQSLPQDLVGETPASFRFAVFGAPGGSTDWLGMAGPLGRSVAAEWVRKQSDRYPIMADSFVMLAALAALGKGRALMPVFLGNAWGGLEMLSVPDDLEPTPIWVASHVDFAGSGRLRRARKYILGELEARQDVLMG